MFAFKFEVRTKKNVLVKTKLFSRQTVISINQLFKVNEHTPSTLAAADQWPCRWRSGGTQSRQKLIAALDCRRSRTSRPFLFQHFCGNSCSNRLLLKPF